MLHDVPIVEALLRLHLPGLSRSERDVPRDAARDGLLPVVVVPAEDDVDGLRCLPAVVGETCLAVDDGRDGPAAHADAGSGVRDVHVAACRSRCGEGLRGDRRHLLRQRRHEGAAAGREGEKHGCRDEESNEESHGESFLLRQQNCLSSEFLFVRNDLFFLYMDVWIMSIRSIDIFTIVYMMFFSCVKVAQVPKTTTQRRPHDEDPWTDHDAEVHARLLDEEQRHDRRHRREPGLRRREGLGSRGLTTLTGRKAKGGAVKKALD